jgi:hypothetical protein
MELLKAATSNGIVESARDLARLRAELPVEFHHLAYRAYGVYEQLTKAHLNNRFVNARCLADVDAHVRRRQKQCQKQMSEVDVRPCIYTLHVPEYQTTHADGYA